jgi:alkanesulfonate monooxygenase
MAPAFVGTPERVVAAMMRYYDIGMHGFLFRGFDLLADAREFGRDLIPMLKDAALARDALAAGRQDALA